MEEQWRVVELLPNGIDDLIPRWLLSHGPSQERWDGIRPYCIQDIRSFRGQHGGIIRQGQSTVQVPFDPMLLSPVQGGNNNGNQEDRNRSKRDPSELRVMPFLDRNVLLRDHNEDFSGCEPRSTRFFRLTGKGRRYGLRSWNWREDDYLLFVVLWRRRVVGRRGKWRKCGYFGRRNAGGWNIDRSAAVEAIERERE